MALAKKGIFFTLTSISLLALIIFIGSISYQYKYSDKASITEVRVDTMNSFVKNIDGDLARASYIASFRSLVSIQEFISTKGIFIENLSSAFKELFLNGTLNGTNVSFMENNTFGYWSQKIEEESNKIGINMNVSAKNVSIFQQDPWRVAVDVNVSIYFYNAMFNVSWSKNKTVSIYVDIVGFEDPFYTIYTNGNVIKNIRRTPYEGNYTHQLDVTNLEVHVNETYYAAFTGAPSFLMRLQNDTSASQYGIESLVDKSKVDAYHSCDDGTAAKSSVDYLYWSCSPISAYEISGMSIKFPNFRIDNSSSQGKTHLEKYNVTHLAIVP